MATIILSGSVGRRGRNAPQDVATVRARLNRLGFHWVSMTGTGTGNDLVQAIRLFQAICRGHQHLRGRGVTGTIAVGDFTHQWLAAQNAPGWVLLYGQKGTGWCSSVDVHGNWGGTPYTLTNGGYGTTWILKTLADAARAYYRSGSLFPSMWVRDCAPERGGNARYHGSHETGIDLDLRLPLNPVGGLVVDSTWRYLGTRAERRRHLYRDAVVAQLTALVAQPLVSVIGYEDDTTPQGERPIHTRFRKVRDWDNHEHHFHVRIQPPTQIPGTITQQQSRRQLSRTVRRPGSMAGPGVV